MAHRKTERHTHDAEEETLEPAEETPSGREGPTNPRSRSASRDAGNRAEDRNSEVVADATDEAYDRMKRAEEMVDRIGERVGYYTTQVGHTLLRWAARAREEVEDMVAEAQSLRQRKQP